MGPGTSVERVRQGREGTMIILSENGIQQLHRDHQRQILGCSRAYYYDAMSSIDIRGRDVENIDKGPPEGHMALPVKF